MTHRRRIATDPRLASSALACDQRSSEQCRQNGTGILTTLGKFQRLSYLPLNLWFTRHQRIQATCNAEQVEYRFFASEIIAVRLKLAKFYPSCLAQYTQQGDSRFMYLRAYCV